VKWKKSEKAQNKIKQTKGKELLVQDIFSFSFSFSFFFFNEIKKNHL
jgi:hypothetical protein